MSGRKIIVLCKGRFEYMPPVMTVALHLRALSYEVTVICSASTDPTKTFFGARGIKIVDVCQHIYNAASMTDKFKHWWLFRSRVWKLIDEEDALLWVGSADTCLAMGRRLLKRSYILELLELYDKAPIYRKGLGGYARKAERVVVPEYCRGAIFRSWYQLSRSPIVVPNKPADHPREPYLFIRDDNARASIKAIDREHIILYQGHLSADRNLTVLVQSIKELGVPFKLVFMGNDHGCLERLMKIYNNLVYISHINAPFHLEVTSHAFIGICTYSYSDLNNVFCAPNKIWEFAGFGIPTLCQNIPGLVFSVGASGSGVCVDFEDSEDIKRGLRQIQENYETFGSNAKRFFDSMRVEGVLEEMMRDLAA